MRPSIFTRVQPWAREHADDFITLVNRIDLFSQSASVAYYTVLSLIPFFLLLFGVLAKIGLDNLSLIKEDINEAFGPSTGALIESLQTHFQSDQGGMTFSLIGIGTLIFSATGIILQLQMALNKIFEDDLGTKKPPASPDATFFKQVHEWITTQLFSVIILLGCVLLAIATVIVSILVRFLIPSAGQNFINDANTAGGLMIFVLIFTFMFKLLPTTQRLSWRFSVRGGLLCALLFSTGKWGFEVFLSHSARFSSYGALSSLMLFLVWAYYSAMMILISACLSQVLFKESHEKQKTRSPSPT